MTADLRDAARALARQTLEYAGWLNGTLNPLMDGDVALCRQAVAVFEALGEEAPMRVKLKRGRRFTETPALADAARQGVTATGLSCVPGGINDL